MKNLILLLLFFLSFSVMSAQKIKMKNGIVYVDKKESLKYDKNGFYTLDGVRLFTIKRVKAKVPSDLHSDGMSRNIEIVYTKVKFSMFDLEFETDIREKKLIRGFYREKVINQKGLIDESKAWEFVRLRHKNMSARVEYYRQ